MAKPVLRDPENPGKPLSTITSSPSKPNYCKPPLTAAAKKISFSVVVISVPLLYVSLLHISPSSLFNDTKFWFLMSNAIILIVAADSGMFVAASDGENADIYDEYVKHSRSRSTSGFLLQETPRIQWEGEEEEANTCLSLVPSRGPPQKEEQTSKERCPRRVPELAAPSAADAVEGGSALSLPASEETVCTCEEESEYEAMSDEELNRRVEEFIRRFNREIRRQETAC